MDMSSEQTDWRSSPKRFFGKLIQVAVEGEVRRPASFELDDETYVIKEILIFWQDFGFGKGPQRRHRWWQRRHRNYYR